MSNNNLVNTTYPYYKYINTPAKIGMSSKGSLSALGKDIDGLKDYLEVLVSGGGKASATGNPLGNKFFIKTPGKCKDKATNEVVDRYIYINNVPTGNIPFISSAAGTDFKEFKGLIPGIMSNLNVFDPKEIFQAFLSGSHPDCQQITMETIDIHNNKSTETNYVTLTDIQNMDPCLFSNNKNPVTNANCNETFANFNDNSYTIFKKPTDTLAQIYFTSLSLLGLYMLYGIMVKNSMIPKNIKF